MRKQIDAAQVAKRPRSALHIKKSRTSSVDRSTIERRFAAEIDNRECNRI
jgi:hypothetical protein